MNANANHIGSSISGSGEINMWGTVDRCDLTISGSGSIRAYGLESNTSYANISGSGSMYLYVNDYLDVVISGSGSVYYQGNPNVNAKITGSGSVIPSN